METGLDVLERDLSESELKKLNPVVLAWVGDAVFSYYVRKYLTIVCGITSISKLHQKSIRFVSAEAQSEIVHVLLESELTEKEREIVKKGRNTHSSVPKHATVHEYRYATGFESLIGWLTLKGEIPRVRELSRIAIEIIEKNLDEVE